MVLRPTSKRETIKYWISWVVLMMPVVVLAVVWLGPEPAGEEVVASEPIVEPSESESELQEPETGDVEVARIDYGAVIDEWVKTGGNRSVLVYDLERNELVGSYAPNTVYDTASLYKLFVVYEGYRRVQSGEWQAEAAAGSAGHSIVGCLDLAIRESDSLCAETLWGMIGRDELDRIVAEDFGLHDLKISELAASAADVATMLKIYYEHREITDEELVARMKDSFLNQPVTTYNWRQGLPAGFTQARVYNKTGWDFNPDEGYWNIYHDAAIIEFPEEDRHFIVVVMTNHVPFEQIRKLGTKIEEAYVAQTGTRE